MSLTKKIYKQHREEMQAVQDAPARDKLRISIEKRLENIEALVEGSVTKMPIRTMALRAISESREFIKTTLDKMDELTDEIPF